MLHEVGSGSGLREPVPATGWGWKTMISFVLPSTSRWAVTRPVLVTAASRVDRGAVGAACASHCLAVHGQGTVLTGLRAVGIPGQAEVFLRPGRPGSSELAQTGRGGR